MPLPVIDRATGQPVELPEGQAQAAFLAGKVGFRKGQQVPVVQGGVTGTMPAEELGAALLDPSTRLATGEELQTAKDAVQFGGTGGSLKAAGAGLARGGTAGISDPLLVTGAGLFGGDKGAEEMRKGLATRKKLFEGISTGTELLGLGLSTLATGGAAAGAKGAVGLGAKALKAATVIPRGITAAGGLAERAAFGLLGGEAAGAASLATKLTKASLGSAARWGTEGALYGASSEISEATLGNHELTAESLLASMGRSGAGAALLGAAAPLAGKALAKATESVMGKLESYAEASAFKAGGAKLKDYRKAAANYGEDAHENIGRLMLDEIPKETGKAFRSLSEEELHAASDAIAKRVGAEKGQLLKSLDAVATREALPDAGNIYRKVTKEVLKPLKGRVGLKNVEAGVRSYLDDFFEKSGLIEGEALSLGKLQEIQSDLGRVIRDGMNPVNPSPMTGELKAVRKILKGELSDASARAAKQAPEMGDVVATLQDLDKRYASFITVAKMAKDDLMRQDANRVLSLTDMMTGGSVLAGATSAALSGGDPMEALKGAALGAGSAIGHKILRERGRFWVADGLDRLSKIGAAKAASDAVQKDVAKGVAGFFQRTDGKAPLGAAVAAMKPWSEETYEKRVQRLRQESPAAKELAEQAISSLGPVAPQTAKAFVAASTRGTDYLVSKIPRPAMRSASLTPHLEPFKPSAQERQEFALRVQTVENPMSAIKAMQVGILAKAQIEALRAVYPQIYKDVIATVGNHLAKRKKAPSYQAKLQLAILTGEVTDETLTPQFLQMAQANFAPPQEAQSPRQSTGKAPDIAGAFSTEVQRTEAGDL